MNVSTLEAAAPAKNLGKSYGRDFPIDRVTFEAETAGGMTDNVIASIEAAFNDVGFAILSLANQVEPRTNLLALAPLFGRVVPHNRSDRQGILGVNAIDPKEGFIDSSHEAHPPHTDGAFKDEPEKVIALQCVVGAKSGGISLLGSGKLAYDALTEQERRPLHADDAIEIVRNEQASTKPVFKRIDGRVHMCFRLDGTAQTNISSKGRTAFQHLKENLDKNLLHFNLEPHQILIVDNTSNVHGRTEYPQGSTRHYNRLNFDGDGLLKLKFGFVAEP